MPMKVLSMMRAVTYRRARPPFCRLRTGNSTTAESTLAIDQEDLEQRAQGHARVGGGAKDVVGVVQYWAVEKECRWDRSDKSDQEERTALAPFDVAACLPCYCRIHLRTRARGVVLLTGRLSLRPWADLYEGWLKMMRGSCGDRDQQERWRAWAWCRLQTYPTPSHQRPARRYAPDQGHDSQGFA